MIEIIALIVLSLIIALLLGVLAFVEYQNRLERAKLIHALITKTPEQFRDLELTDKVKPIKTPEVNPEPDLIHESEMPQDKFNEMIEKEVG